MKPTTYLRGGILASTLIGVSTLAWAQDAEIEDGALVVTASRLPEYEIDTASTVSLLEADELERQQVPRLQDSLNLVPGVIATSTAGQEGSLGSLIIRGLKTQYNQVLVDGVRISDSVSSGTYGTLLANYGLGGQQNLEVAKGAQSSIHGNAALGGVVGVNTPFSDEEFGGRLSQEMGSHDYTRSDAAVWGSQENLRYYLNAGVNSYEQDQPSDLGYEVESEYASLGVEYDLNEIHTLRFTGRKGESDLARPDNDISEDYELFGLHLRTNVDDVYESSLVLGYFDQEYDTAWSSFGYLFSSEFEKLSLTFDNKYYLNDSLTLKAGLDLAHNEYATNDTFSGEKDTEWETYGLYLGGQYELGELRVSALARIEEHSRYDVLPAFEAALSYTFVETGTELFTRYASAYRAPSLLESEAFPAAFQIANSNLEREQISSIELGARQDIGSHSLELTAYTHFLQDAIGSINTPAFETQAVNLEGTSEIFGLEAELSGELMDAWSYQLVWNYSMRNEVTEIPRNTLGLNVYYDADKWLVGAGLSHRSQASYDKPGGAFSSPLDAHLITRLYGHYQVSDSLKLSARVENLLDEQYEVNPFAFGDPELGKGVSAYVGLSYEW